MNWGSPDTEESITIITCNHLAVIFLASFCPGPGCICE
nr:MAG TPA: hypothetical protein [Caudoviricetes sp.]